MVGTRRPQQLANSSPPALRLDHARRGTSSSTARAISGVELRRRMACRTHMPAPPPGPCAKLDSQTQSPTLDIRQYLRARSALEGGAVAHFRRRGNVQALAGDSAKENPLPAL